LTKEQLKGEIGADMNHIHICMLHMNGIL